MDRIKKALMATFLICGAVVWVIGLCIIGSMAVYNGNGWFLLGIPPWVFLGMFASEWWTDQ